MLSDPKISATYLLVMTEIKIGNAKLNEPVNSNMMTTNESVIRVTPAKKAADPTIASKWIIEYKSQEKYKVHLIYKIEIKKEKDWNVAMLEWSFQNIDQNMPQWLKKE